jgi:hypothetical protein
LHRRNNFSNFGVITLSIKGPNIQTIATRTIFRMSIGVSEYPNTIHPIPESVMRINPKIMSLVIVPAILLKALTYS